METLSCLRCGAAMEHLCRETLQLGQTGWLLGSLPNLIAGGLEVEIYSCTRCGKIEFFQAGRIAAAEPLPQKTCPRCGRSHDFDCPKCPFCKYDYYGK